MNEKKQFDVFPLSHGINLDEVGKYGKFINFIRYTNPSDPSDYEVKLEKNYEGRFYSSSLECENLDKEKRIKALSNMIECLKKHTEKKVKEKLREQEEKIRHKINSTSGLYQLEEKLEKLKIESMENFDAN